MPKIKTENEPDTKPDESPEELPPNTHVSLNGNLITLW